ncbi:MAG: hypothetical protein HDKAJFGB_03739 [Anaerolineae bacterium]|nr:hypothetical protein [Anaerolineae bacterium]
MFPILLIAIGIIVLVIGSRLAVLGAAVGVLLGVTLLQWIPGAQVWWIQLGVPIALGVLGFLGGGFAKGIVNIVLMVIGAVAGVAIVFGFLDLFHLGSELWGWILAFIGGIIGFIAVTRYREWAMIALAGIVGALLVVRGLESWLPMLEGAIGTLVTLVLAGASIAYQGGLVGGKKPAT